MDANPSGAGEGASIFRFLLKVNEVTEGVNDGHINLSSAFQIQNLKICCVEAETHRADSVNSPPSDAQWIFGSTVHRAGL